MSYTGYRIDTMRAANPRSPLYNTISTFKTYDTDMCPNYNFYYSFTDGTESYFRWAGGSSMVICDSNTYSVSVISDLGGVITKLNGRTFQLCKTLTSVSFPNCSTIGNSAFYSCSGLTTALFPNCITIGDYAFANCNNLNTMDFTKCETIWSDAFENCVGLSSVYFPNCTHIHPYAFLGCILSSLNLPVADIISAYALQGCYILKSCFNVGGKSATNNWGATLVDSIEDGICMLSNGTAVKGKYSIINAYNQSCTSIGSNAFRNLSYLTTVSFPNVLSIGNSAFASCSNLKTASFPNVSYIGDYAFANCKSLNTLYLMGSSVVTLYNSAVFVSTPFTSRYGSIYVPNSLVNSYKANTAWRYYTSIIVGV